MNLQILKGNIETLSKLLSEKGVGGGAVSNDQRIEKMAMGYLTCDFERVADKLYNLELSNLVLDRAWRSITTKGDNDG